MLLLALDTSTSAITVAVHDGDRVLAESSEVDSRAHGELLAPGVQGVLRTAGAAPSDLTDIVCGLGPGPFTGLRVGIVTARVLAHVTGATLHGWCSLDALAAAALAASGATEVLVATDARRKEVYWARYAAGPHGPLALTAPAVTRPDTLPEGVRALPTAGRGPLLYPELFPYPTAPLDVSAGVLAQLAVQRLGRGEAPTAGDPLYLRRPDATLPSTTARAASGPAGSVPTSAVGTAVAPPTSPTGSPVGVGPARAAGRGSGAADAVRVRDLHWHDLAEVSRLERELFPHDAWSEATWWAELAGRPRRDYVVVEAIDGTIAGYAGLDHAGPTADVMTLAVAAAYRGMGVGDRLVGELAARAAARGAQALLLEVRADNEPASALYRRNDFRQLSVRRGYYQPGGVDAIVLRRLLQGEATS